MENLFIKEKYLFILYKIYKHENKIQYNRIKVILYILENCLVDRKRNCVLYKSLKSVQNF